MKINSMDIKNYRNFSELHVDFDPRLTVFVGANGSGKTTILDALAIFLEMIADSYLRYPEDIVISLKDVRIQRDKIDEIIFDPQIAYKFYYKNNDNNFLDYTVYHHQLRIQELDNINEINNL